MVKLFFTALFWDFLFRILPATRKPDWKQILYHFSLHRQISYIYFPTFQQANLVLQKVQVVSLYYSKKDCQSLISSF